MAGEATCQGHRVGPHRHIATIGGRSGARSSPPGWAAIGTSGYHPAFDREKIRAAKRAAEGIWMEETRAGGIRADQVAVLLVGLVLLGIPCLIGCLP